jgi:hypothetical protein
MIHPDCILSRTFSREVNMKKYQYLAGVLALLAQTAFAEPQPVGNAAALQAKQLRLDVAEKQKTLANDSADATPAPAPALDLPIDETDSPGATK